MSQPAQNEHSERMVLENFIKLLRLKPDSEKAFRAGMKIRAVDGAPVTMVLKFGSGENASPDCFLGWGKAKVEFLT